MRNRLILATSILLAPLAAQADSFRCGKWIIDSDMSVAELQQKCGAPSSREVRTEDVKARNRNNGLMVKTGETRTERWTYDRGSQAPPIVVIIVDGRIRSIERLMD